MNLRSLLPKAVRRQIRLIEILYISTQEKTREEIDQLWGFPIKALDADIKTINQVFPLFTIIHNHSGYTILHDSEYGIDLLYTQVLQSSLEFDLLEQLLFENHENIHDLANYLYTSPATVSRIFKKIATALKGLDISITRRPMRLVGNEATIRYLFTEYYREKKLDFAKLSGSIRGSQAIRLLIEDFMLINHFSEGYATKVQLEYSFYVSLIRISNGHFFPENRNNSTAVITPDFAPIQSAILEIEKHFALLFDSWMYRECLWLYYGDYLISSKIQWELVLSTNKMMASLKKDTDTAISIFEKTLALTLTDGETAAISQKEALCIKLCMDDYLFLVAGDYISILGEFRKIFIISHTQMYPNQIKKIAAVLKDIYQKLTFDIPQDLYYTHLFLLIAYFPDLLLKLANQQDKLNVLIVSMAYSLPDSFILGRFKEKLKGPIEYFFIDSLSQLEQEPQLIEKTDLIISTSSVSTRFAPYYTYYDKPMYVIEPYMSLRGFEELQLQINQLIDQKTAVTN
ncbi:helix-turn-helix domain-containing protein [Enterococcus sp. LJL90]